MSQYINVSFKNSEKEIQMYIEAVSHSGRVNWIQRLHKFLYEIRSHGKTIKTTISR